MGRKKKRTSVRGRCMVGKLVAGDFPYGCVGRREKKWETAGKEKLPRLQGSRAEVKENGTGEARTQILERGLRASLPYEEAQKVFLGKASKQWLSLRVRAGKGRGEGGPPGDLVLTRGSC